MLLNVLAADSMDSSSKQFVSVDDVHVISGDSSAGIHVAEVLSVGFK